MTVTPLDVLPNAACVPDTAGPSPQAGPDGNTVTTLTVAKAGSLSDVQVHAGANTTWRIWIYRPPIVCSTLQTCTPK